MSDEQRDAPEPRDSPDPRTSPDPSNVLDRPDTTAAGNALLYVWGSLLLFGAFLLVVPGRQAAGRTWLWIGLVVFVASVVGFTSAVRARVRYLRKDDES